MLRSPKAPHFSAIVRRTPANAHGFQSELTYSAGAAVLVAPLRGGEAIREACQLIHYLTTAEHCTCPYCLEAYENA